MDISVDERLNYFQQRELCLQTITLANIIDITVRTVKKLSDKDVNVCLDNSQMSISVLSHIVANQVKEHVLVENGE